MGESLSWNVGLVSTEKKYLTAETFGFKINANGPSMKKKQIWTLEIEGETYSLKSHLGRYLAADSNGNLSCDSEEKTSDCKFKCESQPDGKWVLKSFHNMYVGGTGDQLKASSVKAPQADMFWNIHLAIHPQVNLYSISRKRYAHLSDGEIHVTEDIPWGADTLITLEYKDGKYALVTSNNRFLSKKGTLESTCNDDSLFVLEFRESNVSFRDNDGKHLIPVGTNGLLQSKNDLTGKDKLFTMEDSHPQCVLTAHNGRKVSVKQGMDVTANQNEVDDTETFQMSFTAANKVVFLTNTRKYWEVKGNGSLTASSSSKTPNTEFEIEWHGIQVALKANNGNYVMAKGTGGMAATSESVTEKEKYTFELINRPLLVLRGEYGFVGRRQGATYLECNRSSPEVYQMLNKDGIYIIGAGENKFWKCDESGAINCIASEDDADKFEIVVMQHSKLSIKAQNGNFLKGEQNGKLSVSGSSQGKDTVWEY